MTATTCFARVFSLSLKPGIRVTLHSAEKQDQVPMGPQSVSGDGLRILVKHTTILTGPSSSEFGLLSQISAANDHA